MLEIGLYQKQIADLCSSNKVSQLYLFGSALTDKFENHSDIDLLVDFKALTPSEYAENYFSLKSSLEKIFGRSIDLLEMRSIRNPYLDQEINKAKHLLYVA